MTAKSDLVIAHEASRCGCPAESKAPECTDIIRIGDHIGYLDADPDPLVYTAVAYCMPCWTLAPDTD